MRKLIQTANKEYFLKPGDKRFSPIIQTSAFIGLKYISIVERSDSNNVSPLFFCFPDKKMASTWLTISLLTNLFYEDYIESGGLPSINLMKGYKYSLYGSIAKYVGEVYGKGEKEFKFEFVDKGTVSRKESIKQVIKDVSQSRVVNKLSHYRKNRDRINKNRTSISKILEPDEGVLINDQTLTSKILLVTGRGQTKHINSILDSCQVYKESLRQVYSPNDNILVKTDLKEYVPVFDTGYKSKVDKFVLWANKLVRETNHSELAGKLCDIIQLIKNHQNINDEIDTCFLEIVEEHSDEEPRLQKLKESIYPGIGSELPENLRAVVINDIDQLVLNPETITGFLSKKIPVIILSNRMISEHSYYSQLFENKNGKYKDSYRVNWNRAKIKELAKNIEQNENILDKELWEICLRYSDQIIQIKVTDEPNGYSLDKKIRYLQQSIGNLEGYEDLKKAFFQLLYPVLYAVKNSRKANTKTAIIIKEFMDVWNKNHHYLENQELVNEVDTTLEVLNSKSFINTKEFTDQQVFCDSVSIPDQGEIQIPLDIQNNRLPSNESKQIIFSGFPYREFSKKYLIDAALQYFIPRISILCWPLEGHLTYNYLRRIIESGYFIDNIPDNINFPKEFMLKDRSDYIHDINLILKTDIEVKNNGEIFSEEERGIIKLDNFQFEQFRANGYDDQVRYIVRCNIVRFDDGCFMFLPSQSTVLSEYEGKKGNSIKRLNFSDLAVGLRVFEYNRDQVNYEDILHGNKEIEEANKDLSIWHITLSNLVHLFSSIGELSKYLKSIAADHSLSESNADIVNLKRWLKDEDLIAPSEDNLRLLILSANEKGILRQDPEDCIRKIVRAYKIINAAHISIGHQIKTAISNQLKLNNIKENQLITRINNNNIDIAVKTITELDKNNIEIDYHNTRKFIC